MLHATAMRSAINRDNSVLSAALELADRQARQPVADFRRRWAAQHLAIERAGIVGIEDEIAHLASAASVLESSMHGARQGG